MFGKRLPTCGLISNWPCVLGLKSRQITGMESVLGGAPWVHVQAGVLVFGIFSTLQLESQPSPFCALPSSHSSGGRIRPSPQVAKHWYDTVVCWARGRLVFTVPHRGSLV